MPKNIIYSVRGAIRCKKIELVSDPSMLKSALNPIALQILEKLWDHEAYPSELAKELGVDEQKIYYYIHHLQKAGLIEIVSKREIKGAVAKYFKTVAPAFGFEMPFGEGFCDDLPYMPVRDDTKDFLKEIFRPFLTKDDIFNGRIVVGSPDPHGPFMAHARDGHYALYVAMALGRFCRMPVDNFIKLDTELRAENRLKENLIIIGGPGVNLITAEFNEHLPVYLTGDAHGQAPRAVFGFDLYSERTKRTYKDPAIGYIIKRQNPLAQSSSIMVAAGLGRRGTKAAIIALTRNASSFIQKSEIDEFSHVVRGIDKAGKGEIDDVEILE